MSVAFRSANERHFRGAKGDNGAAVLADRRLLRIFCYAISDEHHEKALLGWSFPPQKNILNWFGMAYSLQLSIKVKASLCLAAGLVFVTGCPSVEPPVAPPDAPSVMQSSSIDSPTVDASKATPANDPKAIEELFAVSLVVIEKAKDG